MYKTTLKDGGRQHNPVLTARNPAVNLFVRVVIVPLDHQSNKVNPKRLDQKTGSSKNKMERQSHQAADRTPYVLC